MLAESTRRRLALLGVLLLLVAAAVLRIRAADERGALWRDEVYEFTLVTSKESIAEMLAVVREDSQSPGHYLYGYAIARVFGPDALLSRWPALLLGWLVVAAVIFAAWRWFGPGCALISGLFATTSPFLVLYSTEMRGYSMLALLSIVYMLVYVEMRERRTTGWVVGWGCAAATLVYAHYYGLFLILVTGLLALLDRPRRRSMLQATLAGGVFLVLFAPWLGAFVDALQTPGQAWASGNVSATRILQPAWVIGGRSGEFLTWAGLVFGGLLVWRIPAERRLFGTLVLSAFGATLAGWLTQLQEGRGFTSRYLIGHACILLPAVMLFWARLPGLASVPIWKGLHTGRVYRLPRAVVLSLGGAAVLGAWVIQIQDESGWTSRPMAMHREARLHLEAHRREGDLVVAAPYVIGNAFRFECRNHFKVLVGPAVPREETVDGRAHPSPEELREDRERLQATMRDRLREGGRVWYYSGSDRAWYSIDSDGPPYWPGPDPALNDFARSKRAVHVEFIRTLNRYGRRVAILDGGDRYRFGARLLLYEPADADSQASNARLRSSPQR